MEKKSFFSNISRRLLGGIIRKGKNISARPPLLINLKKLPYGAFQFQIRLTEGAGYKVYCSTNLLSWIQVFEDKSNSEVVEYVDPDASRYSYRFYRVVSEDIYSENITGYVVINIPPGFAMIANPFRSENNTVGALFAEMPEGSTFNKFDTLLFKLSDNQLKNGKWSKPHETFSPGEGAIIFNPTDDYLPLTFCGEVLTGNLLNPIPAGFSMKSSMVPMAGRLNEDLKFPVTEGDVIHLFDRYKQKYNIYPYDPQLWAINPPIVGIGESFWVGKTSPANWVINFVPGNV